MENKIENTSLELAYQGLKKELCSQLKLKDIVGFGVKPMEYKGFNILIVFADKVAYHCIINNEGHKISEWKEEKQNDKVVKNS